MKQQKTLYGFPGSRILLLSILLAMGGYLGVVLFSGWESVVFAFRKLGLMGIFITLGLSLLNLSFRFLRWQYYLQCLGNRIAWLPSLRIYLCGFAFTATPGRAGEMVRSIYLKKFGVRYVESTAAFFSERLTDLFAVLILSGIGLSSHPQNRLPAIIVLILLLIFFLGIRQTLLLCKLQSWAVHLKWVRLQKILLFIIEIIGNFRQLFTVYTMLVCICAGIIAWGGAGVAFHLGANMMGIAIPLRTSIFIYSFSLLIGAISFFPGGLGSTEGTMIGLLMSQGASLSVAVACTFFIRLAMFRFSVSIGLFTLILDRTQHLPLAES